MKRVLSLVVLLALLAGTATVAGEKTIRERKGDLLQAGIALLCSLKALTEQVPELTERRDVSPPTAVRLSANSQMGRLLKAKRFGEG
jgi:hypothetical protein